MRALLFLLATLAAAADWTRFGGPTGDFTLPAAPIASTWPAGGPKQLWKRLQNAPP